MKVIFEENDETLHFLEYRIKQIVEKSVSQILAKTLSEMNNINVRKREEEWCDTDKALKILDVSRSYLQKLRDGSPENGVIFNKPGKKCRYFVPSLYQFMESSTQ